MLKNEHCSTAVMTETETEPSSPVVALPGPEATVEGLSAAVISEDLRSNRNLRHLLQETGLVYSVQDWSDYRDLNGREIASVPHIVFFGIGQPIGSRIRPRPQEASTWDPPHCLFRSEGAYLGTLAGSDADWSVRHSAQTRRSSRIAEHLHRESCARTQQAPLPQLRKENCLSLWEQREG